MSWSKSANGSASEVREQMAKWADEQKTTDASYSNSAGTAEGHTAQIGCVVETVEKFTSIALEGSAFNVSANGHHNGSGSSDQASVTVSYYIPA